MCTDSLQTGLIGGQSEKGYLENWGMILKKGDDICQPCIAYQLTSRLNCTH